MINETRESLGRVLCCHGRPMNCSECGEGYAAELNQPRQPVIELPDKHPLRIRAEAAERDRNLLRSALVALVGVDGKDDLEQMEGVMRLMPAPAADKAATIDAIHALISTMVEDNSARDAVGQPSDLRRGSTRVAESSSSDLARLRAPRNTQTGSNTYPLPTKTTTEG